MMIELFLDLLIQCLVTKTCMGSSKQKPFIDYTNYRAKVSTYGVITLAVYRTRTGTKTYTKKNGLYGFKKNLSHCM